MKQLVVRIGSALFPLLTSFALFGAACTDDSAPSDDTVEDPTPDAPEAPAKPGDLDKTYGTDGIKELAIGTGYATAIVAQGDKVIVCYTEATPTGTVGHLARFTTDGSLDSTFAMGGIYTLVSTQIMVPSNACTGVTIQRDGKIMMSLQLGGYNNTVPLSEHGIELGLSNIATNFTTRLVPMHSSDGVTGASLENAEINFASRWNNATNTQAFITSATTIGAMLLTPTDGPLAVANVSTANGATWQLLHATGSAMAPLGASATLGQPMDDQIRGAMWLPDGSVLAYGGVDNDREVMAARFSVNGEASMVEHHSFGGISTANGGTIDATGGAILVGSEGMVGKAKTFAWQRYVTNSVILDAAYQQGGLVTIAPPSGSGELVDVAEVDGSLFALGTYGIESATPHMALLKITE